MLLGDSFRPSLSSDDQRLSAGDNHHSRTTNITHHIKACVQFVIILRFSKFLATLFFVVSHQNSGGSLSARDRNAQRSNAHHTSSQRATNDDSRTAKRDNAVDAAPQHIHFTLENKR